MCAIGAISFAATGIVSNAIGNDLVDILLSNPRKLGKQFIDANVAVRDFGNWLESNGVYGVANVPRWNDHKAKDKEEVIRYMEKFADEVDPQRP
jgi:hypothetical protein